MMCVWCKADPCDCNVPYWGYWHLSPHRLKPEFFKCGTRRLTDDFREMATDGDEKMGIIRGPVQREYDEAWDFEADLPTERNAQPANATGPINDATCPNKWCRETRCSLSERVCWRCGTKL